MISLEVRGQAAFQAAIKDAITRIPREVSRDFGRWTMRVFYDLVDNTPQWSGDLAANWNYSVGTPDGGYAPIVRKALSWPPNPAYPPLQKGDKAAVYAAHSRAEDGPQPLYNQPVYFTNNTPIAPEVESESIYIRPVNLVDSRVQMAQFTADKWRNLPV